MICCKVDLGNVPHIGPANTGVNAIAGGEYRFEIPFLGSIGVKRQTFNIGEEITIPGPFNESMTYTVKIFDVTGEPVFKLVDGVECFDFFFRTFIAVDTECYPNTCEDDDPTPDPYPYS